MESGERGSRGSGDVSAMSRVQEDSELADKYERYVQKAKQEAKNGNLLKSIEYFQKADTIHPSEKLKGRIAKLEEALQQLGLQNEEDDEFVDVLGSGLMLYKDLFNKLFEHQKEGVAFMYSLYRDGRKGGILADDMGLGKTIQVIAFLSGMFDAEFTNNVLLIMPTTLISNWVKEFEKWTPGMRVNEFHGTSKKERTRNLEKIQRKGGVLITTYQMLINNWQQLATYNGREFVWDYIILDEAHKIKSTSTKTAKSCYAIPAKNRVLLTGTPVQNNLREMWALYDFACQGTLLGTAKTFKMEYENPITRAREKDSTPGEKALGLKISENLMRIIQPYFLRRTKNDVQHKKASKHSTANESNHKVCTMPSLTRKNDLIIWVYLSSIQEDVYRKFISLDQIKELMMTTRSPLAELNILKKLCDHPRLLSARACVQLGLEGDSADEDDVQAVTKFDHLSDEALIEESGKLVLLIELLNKLREEGHRTLVFSQSRKMLDMIDRILNNRGFKIMRIDGTVSLLDREKRISMFQTNRSYSVLLLTTQVGGVGLTLTSADRVVIFDPSWNPATDAQAVDRAYRIGQQANVVIYRLITCGTVEEKIYRRQIFKDSLIRQTTGEKKNPFRYFSKQELKELFSLEDTRTSSTQIQLQNMHSSQRKTDTNLDEHIAYLHTLPIFGISDHDLIYNHEISQDDEGEDEEACQYIQERVQKAHELVQMESQMNEQLMEQLKKGSEGAWLRPNAFPEIPKQRSLPNSKPLFPPPEIVDLTEHEISNISCHMTSLVIEDSEENLPPVSFKKEPQNDVNPHMDSLIIEDSSEEGLPSAPPNYETSKNGPQTSVVLGESFEENLPQVLFTNELKRESAAHTTNLIPEDVDEKDTSSLNPFTKTSPSMGVGSPVLNGHSGMENIISPVHSLGNNKSANRFPSFVIKAEEFERPGMEDGNASLKEETSMPLSKSHLQCDFNLILEDSMDNDKHSASVDEMESLMETSMAPLKENLLVLDDSDDSAENMIQDGNCFEKSMDDKRKSTNISVNMEYSKPKLEDSFKGAENIQNEMDMLNSSQENSIGKVSIIDVEDSDEEEIPFSTMRKAARRIYSESEAESSVFANDENEMVFSPFNSPSVKAVIASTPKIEKRLSEKLLHQRSSLGRRRSIASRRSLVHVAVEEATDIQENINDGDDEDSEKEEEEELLADEAQEADQEEHEQTEEEPPGETLALEESLTSSEDYESDSFVVKSSTNEEVTEESTGEVELLSDEQVDFLAPEVNNQTKGSSQEDGYSILVKRGKELRDGGHVKEALDCFLKALDIKSGDPEVMMITLSLYRQLS